MNLSHRNHSPRIVKGAPICTRPMSAVGFRKILRSSSTGRIGIYTFEIVHWLELIHRGSRSRISPSIYLRITRPSAILARCLTSRALVASQAFRLGVGTLPRLNAVSLLRRWKATRFFCGLGLPWSLATVQFQKYSAVAAPMNAMLVRGIQMTPLSFAQRMAFQKTHLYRWCDTK